MSKTITIEEFKNKISELEFNFALQYLFLKGEEYCKAITDEQIERVTSNSFMTKEYMQNIIKNARTLSYYNLFEDILPNFNKDKVDKYLSISYNAITLGQLNEQYDPEDLAYELGCDIEDLITIMSPELDYLMEE